MSGEMFIYSIADAWAKIEVDSSKHIVFEAHGYLSQPLVTGSFQVTYAATLEGEQFVFKQHRLEEYGFDNNGKTWKRVF